MTNRVNALSNLPGSGKVDSAVTADMRPKYGNEPNHSSADWAFTSITRSQWRSNTDVTNIDYEV